MKIRTDFVTNSSSTSFMIASKEELTKAKLHELFGIPEGYLLHDLSEEIVEIIFRRIRPVSLRKSDDLPSQYVVGIEAYLCATDLNINTQDVIMIHRGGY